MQKDKKWGRGANIMKKQNLKRIMCIIMALLICISSLPCMTMPVKAAEKSYWNGEIASSFAGGNGSESNPYQISNGAELALLAKLVNENKKDSDSKYYNSKYYVLTDDIYLNDCTGWESWTSGNTKLNMWTPIGNGDYGFKGKFNGQGKCIYGMYIDSSADYEGIFGYAYDAKIENMCVKMFYVKGRYYIGGLLGNGYNYRGGMTISKCVSYGNCSGQNFVGGIAGCDVDKIEYCSFYGSIEGDGWIGGIIGSNTDEINNCINYGNVQGNKFVGGIIGTTSSANIFNCRNNGNVAGDDKKIGGIVGYVSDFRTFNLDSVINKGEISGGSQCGGMVGYINAYYEGTAYVNNVKNYGPVKGNTGVGGLIGCLDTGLYDSTIDITNSFNIADVVGNEKVGGILGTVYSIDLLIYIRNCYNTGNIVSNSAAGGIYASYSTGYGYYNKHNVYIYQSYNIGKLTGSYQNPIGAIKSKNGRYTDCYYLDSCVTNPANSEGTSLTLSQMKSKSSFVGFDFDTVWDIDENVNNGFPFLRENFPADVLNIAQTMNLKTDEFLIYVFDSSTQTPIENVNIEIDGKEFSTNNEGKVVFSDIQDGVYHVTATHPSYRNYDADYYFDIANKVFIIYMEEGEPDDYYISSAMLHETNTIRKDVDIRNNMVNITKYSEEDDNKEYDISVCVNLKEGMELEEVVIAQHGGAFVKSSTGYFEKKKLGNIFDNNGEKDIYIYAKTKDGQITAPLCYTLLNIQTESFEGDVDLGETINLGEGEGFKITLPDNCPVFGGQEINLRFADILPVSIEVSGDEAKIVISREFEKDEDNGKFYVKEYESYKEKIKEAKKKYKESEDNLDKVLMNTGVDRESFATTSIKPSFKQGGYLEFKKIDDKWKLTEGELMILGKCKYSYSNPFWVGTMPCYYSVSGGLSLCWEGKCVIVAPQEDLISTLENAFQGNIEGEISGSLEGGIGIPKVVTLGVNGEAILKYLHGIGRDYNKVSLEGSASIVSSVLGNEIYKGEFLNGTFLIYETGNENGLINGVSTMSLDDIDTGNKVTPVSREYSENESYWIGGADAGISTLSLGDDVQEAKQKYYTLETGVYPYAETRLMESDGKKILLWLKDNSERSAINRTMLVYSVYDEENQLWSEPVAVLDDGKADFYPHVSDNYVVWMKLDKEFDENTTLDEMAASGEIYLSKWNGNGFNEPVKITNNEMSDTLPSVCADGDKVSVVWIENSENDLLGNSGTNTIYESHLEGDLFTEPSECVEVDSAIIDIDTAYVDDKVAIAYTEDMDGSLDTSDDWEMFLHCNQVTTQITDNEVLDSTPTFEYIDNNIGLFWFENGNVLYRSDVFNDETKTVLEGENSLNDKYILMSDGNQMAVAWNAENEDSIEIKGAFYDGEKWSNPTNISETNAQLSNISGLMCEDGSILFSYVQTEKMADSGYTSNGETYLCTMRYEPTCNVSVDNVWTDYEELVSGEDIKIYAEITNSGQKDLSDICIELSDDSECLSEKTIDYLGLGESTVVELTYTVPQEIIKKALNVTASIENQQEDDVSDNVLSVEVGQANLEIETISNTDLGTKSLITARVKNIGYDTAENVVVNLCNEIAEGYCLDTVNVGSLQGGDAREVIFSVNFAPEDIKQLYVTTQTDSIEYSYGNNSKYVVLTPFTRNVEMKVNKRQLVFYDTSIYDNFDVEVINKDNADIVPELFSLSTSPDVEIISSALHIESVKKNDETYNLNIMCDIEKEIEEVYLFYDGAVVDRNSISYEVKQVDYSELNDILENYDEEQYTTEFVNGSTYITAEALNREHTAKRQEDVDVIVEQFKDHLADGKVVIAKDENDGYTSGDGRYAIGDYVSLLAENNTISRRAFTGWYKDGELISTSKYYSFYFNETCEIEARYRDFIQPVIEIDSESIQYDGNQIEQGIDFDVILTDCHWSQTINYSYRPNNSEEWIIGKLPTDVGSYELKVSVDETTDYGYEAALAYHTITIEPKDINSSDISANVILPDNCETAYTGEAIPYSVQITDGNVALLENRDYSVEIISEDSSDSETATSAGVNVGKVTLQVTGMGNYTGDVYCTFNIIKANPEYDIPKDLSLKCGGKLSDIELPKGFSWQNQDNTVFYGNVGIIEEMLTYTPDDLKSYNLITDIPVEIKIGHDFNEQDICKICGGTHRDVENDTICDDCGKKLAFIVAGYMYTEDGNPVSGNMMGLANYTANEEATLVAPIVAGYNFVGWYAYDDLVENTKHYKGEKICSSRTYKFSVTADTDLVAVYKPIGYAQITINGGADYIVNGEPMSTQVEESYLLGTQIKVECNDATFEYWENSAGMVVSRENTYTFTVAGKDTISAVFNNVIDNMITIEFESYYGQVIARNQLAVGETMTIPGIPFRYGYTAIGWDYNGDGVYDANKDIFNNALERGNISENKIVKITPIYQLNESIYEITVENGIGTGNYKQNAVVTVQADEAIEGMKFSHWKDSEDNILSYNEKYQFYASENIMVTAIYVEENDSVEVKGTTEIVDYFADIENKKLVFVSMSTVPEGCTINKAGIIATNNYNIGNDEENFNASTAMYVRGNEWSGNAYRFTWSKRNVNLDETWYVRAYLVYTDEEGNVNTLYGDIVSATPIPDSSTNLKLSELYTLTGNGKYIAERGEIEINDAEGDSVVWIELPECVKSGETVTVNLKGTWNGTYGFRVWIGNGGNSLSEEIKVFNNLPKGPFDETFTLKATGDCSCLTIKGMMTYPIDGLTIESIKIK